ncbi:LysE/ArgO family amino acid transporter [Trinickia caryophylli]|uniref:L-lysine exporter family protein LysE/ArgO n=1 Tax=Trinickia caryophylli TaxID=28094 RepID=A0A1X7G2X4_TRICW|nr:LysE/ArgO family amino acid transporter [Trinickia caryophylli]PMS13730.1 amino acid transporter [Trinickia caryophylli]TRX14223.1 amino acid transporter [Trinickia caryophylli]WQE14049.1 LysE/ArgO family amino acid transporter [Trinickia caryophylli]SMF63093.1 L-lysine exporter family protein LysE/ArgO [Trinickia caryophylli]
MNWTAFSHGALLCASLIVTIGAQNAYVLRQGILRSHVGKIVLLCIVSDFVLIGAGVGGASALARQYPTFVQFVLYAGLAYLAWYGIGALRRALRPGHAVMDVNHDGAASGQSAWSVMLMTLAFTWLNPHVYLDAMLLVGTAGAREPQGARVAFALGAMFASLIWFLGLGYGARLLAPLFRKATAWRLLDGATGSMVLLLAATQLR